MGYGVYVGNPQLNWNRYSSRWVYCGCGYGCKGRFRRRRWYNDLHWVATIPTDDYDCHNGFSGYHYRSQTTEQQPAWNTTDAATTGPGSHRRRLWWYIRRSRSFRRAQRTFQGISHVISRKTSTSLGSGLSVMNDPKIKNLARCPVDAASVYIRSNRRSRTLRRTVPIPNRLTASDKDDR